MPAKLLTMRGVRALGVALILIGLSCAMVFTPRGEGWKTDHLHQIPRKNGEFLNYDFESKNRSAENVDWAVSLLFHNAATTRRIIYDLRNHRYLKSSGSPIYGFVTDGSAYPGTGKRWHWRGNRGVKDEFCSVIGDNLHMRTYAPNNSLGSIVSERWGFAVIGTVHYDHNECGLGSWTGMSEEAEREIVRMTRSIYGFSAVRQDQFRFWNAEGEHDEEDHHWEGNGQASAIRVSARRP
jgi:hypothetical protein